MIIGKRFFCKPFNVNATLLIKGEVTKNGVPVSCSLRAYNRKTGELLSHSTSTVEGRYALLGSRIDPNYVIAIDPDSEFNLATQDNVK